MLFINVNSQGQIMPICKCFSKQMTFFIDFIIIIIINVIFKAMFPELKRYGARVKVLLSRFISLFFFLLN